jgi:nicotinic acid phosphoribosyltransferase
LGGRGSRISEFEASLVYKVSSRTARATQRYPVSKNQKKKKGKERKEGKERKKEQEKKERKKEEEAVRSGVAVLFLCQSYILLTSLATDFFLVHTEQT